MAMLTHLHPLHFLEKETEIQRGAVTYPSPHREKLTQVLVPSLVHPGPLHSLGLCAEPFPASNSTQGAPRLLVGPQEN